MKNLSKNFGFTCGWAPQTVTYTSKEKYKSEWKKWVEFIQSNQEKYLAIGEIGLDFHHAKTLEKRTKQIEVFKEILEFTRDFGKPYVLHVRNAAQHEFDNQHPKHRFNKIDGVNKEILNILKSLKKQYAGLYVLHILRKLIHLQKFFLFCNKLHIQLCENPIQRINQ